MICFQMSQKQLRGSMYEILITVSALIIESFKAMGHFIGILTLVFVLQLLQTFFFMCKLHVKPASYHLTRGNRNQPEIENIRINFHKLSLSVLDGSLQKG